MRQILATVALFIFLFPTLALGKDIDWKKDGSYRDGILYLKGVPYTGAYKNYNKNGSLRILENYKNGKKHGIEQIWSDNGLLKTEIHWDYGKHFYMARFDYYENGELRRIGTVKRRPGTVNNGEVSEQFFPKKTGKNISPSRSDIAREALYCSSLFYLLTSLGSADKNLGNLYMNLAMTMSNIYRANQNNNLTNSQLFKKRDTQAQKIRNEYQDEKHPVYESYLRCNTWRGLIGKHVIANKNDIDSGNENRIKTVFRSVPDVPDENDWNWDTIDVAKEHIDAALSDRNTILKAAIDRCLFENIDKIVSDAAERIVKKKCVRELKKLSTEDLMEAYD